jgi:hypothetical protein
VGDTRHRRSFYDVVTEAINDFTEHGYDTQARLDRWMAEIRRAAEAEAIPDDVLDKMLRRTLKGAYERLVTDGGILRYHPGVPKFTLAKVRSKLHAELDRRILASAQLIRLNREEAISATERRFSGWATSIPKGGSRVVDRVDTKTDIRKAMASLPFVQRRVIVDQSHKFTSSLSEILAHDSGAIAGIWHSHWRQANYNYRRDHKERDEKVYAVRGSWAMERGLMNKGAGYTDEMTKPGEEVFCRCFMQWQYSLSKLPPDMLTAKGREALADVKGKAA